MARYVTLSLHLVDLRDEENRDLLRKAHLLDYEGEDAEQAEQLRNQAWATYERASQLLGQWLSEAYIKECGEGVREHDLYPMEVYADNYYTDYSDLAQDYSTWNLTTPKKHELDEALLLAIDRLRREGVISGYSVYSD